MQVGPTGDAASQLAAAEASYVSYVKDQVGALVSGTQESAAAYVAGDDAKARDLYAATRVHWERVEPVVESFGDLDPLLDLREADLEEGQAWTGWHLIEKDLWAPTPEANGGVAYTPLTQAQREAAAAGLVTNTQAVVDAVDAPDFTFEHQAGIVTPAQHRMYVAAFDLTTTSRDALVALLRTWTAMAARLTQGHPAGTFGPASGPYDAPPDDTGEAADLPPAGLTITFGFGRSLFVGTPAPDGTPGIDRFGLAHRLPGALVELPHFPKDALEPARSDGDLVVQACADDPQVAVHAIRNLSRAAFGTATIRWTQLGYGRTSSP